MRGDQVNLNAFEFLKPVEAKTQNTLTLIELKSEPLKRRTFPEHLITRIQDENFRPDKVTSVLDFYVNTRALTLLSADSNLETYQSLQELVTGIKQIVKAQIKVSQPDTHLGFVLILSRQSEDSANQQLITAFRELIQDQFSKPLTPLCFIAVRDSDLLASDMTENESTINVAIIRDTSSGFSLQNTSTTVNREF